MKYHYIAFSLIIQMLCPQLQAQNPTENSVAFGYTHYPPHQYVTKHGFHGEYFDRTIEILTKANLSPFWFPITTPQESALLDNGTRPFCSTGRIYTTKRDKKTVFIPYVFDVLPREFIIASPKAAAIIRTKSSVQDIVNDSNLRGIFIQKNHYHEAVNEALKNRVPWISGQAISTEHAAQMILEDRADYTAALEDRWQHVVKDNPALKTLVPTADFEGLNATPIYLTCTKVVPQIIIDKIALSMKELGYKPAPFIH